jgi:hypothetical protein
MLPGLRFLQKPAQASFVQQTGPMRQARLGPQSGLAAIGLEERAVVARATAIRNNPILFFI